MLTPRHDKDKRIIVAYWSENAVFGRIYTSALEDHGNVLLTSLLCFYYYYCMAYTPQRRPVPDVDVYGL